jgi:DNA (cytosine-5)-methyltransferase 1
MPFTYADLFAGIGGFHAALSALGGECRFVAEIDGDARQVYGANWGSQLPADFGRQRRLDADIVPLTDSAMKVPKTDVLAAGFPCQPFSKSGFQRGINETRGTLFFNILRVLKERPPSVVLLENVRNLAGPRHAETWQMIVRQLRDAGYKVAGQPTVFSPHFLPPEKGGTPQVRDRVFILGTYVGSAEAAWRASEDAPVVPRGPVQRASGEAWDPLGWDLERTVLPFVGGPLLQDEDEYTARYALTDAETRWLDVWDDFVATMWEVRDGVRLPGFPLWADVWLAVRDEGDIVIPHGTPAWKASFLRKNRDLYVDHRDAIDCWFERHGDLAELPPSRRKFEWQAQDESHLWDCVIHMRPSGIRVKRATYLPALVAITQTSIIGPRRRRLTPREAARLQGLPDAYDFGTQSDALTYKQLGNGVSVGAAYYVLREHVRADRALIPARIADAILAAPDCPVVHVPGDRTAAVTAVAPRPVASLRAAAALATA